MSWNRVIWLIYNSDHVYSGLVLSLRWLLLHFPKLSLKVICGQPKCNWEFTLIFFMQSVTESPKMHLMAGVRPFFWNSEPMSPHFCCSPLDSTHHRRTSVRWQAHGWEVRKQELGGMPKKKEDGLTFFLTVHCFHGVVIVFTHPLHGLIWLHFLKHDGRIGEEYSSSSVFFRWKEFELCLLLQRGYHSQLMSKGGYFSYTWKLPICVLLQ